MVSDFQEALFHRGMIEKMSPPGSEKRIGTLGGSLHKLLHTQEILNRKSVVAAGKFARNFWPSRGKSWKRSGEVEGRIMLLNNRGSGGHLVAANDGGGAANRRAPIAAARTTRQRRRRQSAA